MKVNKVKRSIEHGGVAMGTMMLEFSTTGIARIAAEAGAEFAVFDMEHTGWSMETIRMLLATSVAAELVPMVRVPALQYHFISRVLDLGAMGVVVPFVSSAEQARELVAFAKYPPEGRRGVAFGVAHDGYRAGNLVTKLRRANEEVMLIAQIENADGVEQAHHIAAVDGIDALWIGQFDLSTSLGIPGRLDHRFFQEAAHKVLEACRKHGKAAVLGATDPQVLSQGPADGYRMLVYLTDIWIYQKGLRDCFGAIRTAVAGHEKRHS
jgi:2-dehydro-3-deoxyglucarate aldolase/4-hydroxy-2-oxoheptanedioate aldolase